MSEGATLGGGNCENCCKVYVKIYANFTVFNYTDEMKQFQKEINHDCFIRVTVVSEYAGLIMKRVSEKTPSVHPCLPLYISYKNHMLVFRGKSINLLG